MGEAEDLDRAADLTRELDRKAVEEVRNATKPQQVQCIDGSWPNPDCIDCADPIVVERLRMGRIRCFDCQDRLERRGKRWG